MNLVNWATERTKKMDVWDIGFVKIFSFAGGLLLAKLWSPVLSLAWYWYLAIFVLALIRPVYSFLK